MVNQKNYFYCYSHALHNFFKDQGKDIITTALTLRGNRRFWLYENGDDITQLLAAYEQHKTYLSKNVPS